MDIADYFDILERFDNSFSELSIKRVVKITPDKFVYFIDTNNGEYFLVRADYIYDENEILKTIKGIYTGDITIMNTESDDYITSSNNPRLSPWNKFALVKVKTLL